MAKKFNIKKIGDKFKIHFNKWSEVEIPEVQIPEAKLKKWGDECFIKVRYPDFHPVSPIQHEGKLKWKNTDKEVHLYPLEPREFIENRRTVRQLEQGGFEFEVILKKKPKTNKIVLNIETKGLKFYYQPELTQEEKDDGCRRPENVVGSYAVYHESKAGNYEALGGKNYKAGKFGMIYRPKITDAEGNWAWESQVIDVENGKITITIPQDFLDNAVYPISSKGTKFGWSTLGQSDVLKNENMVSVIDGNPGEDGVATSISFGAAKYTNNRLWRGALYLKSNFSLISPQTAEGIINSAIIQYWTNNFTEGPNVSNQDYKVAAFHNAEVNGLSNMLYIAFDEGDKGDGLDDLATYPNWPNPFSTSYTQSFKYSIYCTYIPAVAATRKDLQNEGNISRTYQQNLQSKGDIKVEVYRQNLQSKGILWKTSQEFLNSKGNIWSLELQDLKSKANIVLFQRKILQTKADIVVVSRVDLKSEGHAWNIQREDLQSQADLRIAIINRQDLKVEGDIVVTERKDLKSKAGAWRTYQKNLESQGDIRALVVKEQDLKSKGQIKETHQINLLTQANIGIGYKNDLQSKAYLELKEKLYTKGAVVVLPDDESLQAMEYSSEEYAEVAVSNDVYVSQEGESNRYIIHHFRNRNENNTDPISLTAEVRSPLAPSSSTVYLQIWNETDQIWETLDSNNSANAYAKFTLSETQSTNLSKYYIAKGSYYVVHLRVYQQAT